MSHMPSVLIFSLVAASLAAPAARAHHSTAGFDMSRQVTVQGVIRRYEWANPHVYIFIEETALSGERTEWEIEGQPPTLMRRQGWSRDSLRAGDIITATGAPARNADSHRLLLVTMQREDSTLFDLMAVMASVAAPPAAPLPPADGLGGVWTPRLSFGLLAPFLDPAANLSLTEAGAAAVAAFDESTMSPAAACVPFPAPQFMITPDVKRIAADGDTIRIAGDFDGSERIIHMSGTPDGVQPSVHGHSIGRWEDGTLVIETANFAPHRIGNAAAGLPSGDGKRMVERLTLATDGSSLSYSFELSDPEFLAQSVSGVAEWTHRPDLEFAPLPCDPENARRFTAD